ncbi:hypothetical protein [uncultured Ruegeria sp.]|uniref:hypothetical protein n=1 Tax=uncultured Ruegeria sp. TaxID=259304 RepID=UPI00262028B1|nr:hypothetical protein [uncultured Ruegeria sp.]
MRIGFNGRVAISWKQTDIDGLEAAPLAYLAVGAAWSWRGQAMVLSEAVEHKLEQTGYAGGAASRTGSRFPTVRQVPGHVSGTIVLTNGAQSFDADIVVDYDNIYPTLVFEHGCPPRDQEFWISEVTEQPLPQYADKIGGSAVISFPSQA